MSQEISFSTGGLTEEEVAAITVVIAAASSDDRLRSADDRPLAGGWKSYYRTVRSTMISGRDAWRTYHRM